MNAPIQVEAKIFPEGRVRPLSFLWEGEQVVVASLGRSWREGGERHFLVMSPDERVYELVYLPDGSWRLRRRPQDFQPPRTLA